MFRIKNGLVRGLAILALLMMVSSNIVAQTSTRIVDLLWNTTGQLIATVDYSGTVTVVDTTQQTVFVSANNGFGTRIAWDSTSPERLAVSTLTQGTTLFNVLSGAVEAQFDTDANTYSVSFSPDGRFLLTSHGTPGDGPLGKGSIHVVEITTGSDRAVYEEVQQRVTMAHWSPDGNRIGGLNIGDVGEVVIWDATTGAVIQRLSEATETTDSELGTYVTGSVSDFDWSPDGEILALGAELNIAFWESVAYTRIGMSDYLFVIEDMDWRPNEPIIAVASGYDRQIQLVEVFSGQIVEVIPTSFDVLTVSWSPDGTQLAFSGITDLASQIVDVPALVPPTDTVTLTFTPIDDTRVSSQAPNNSYGSLSTASVVTNSSDAINAYFKFDLSGITAPVQRATLRLYTTDGADTGGSLYTVANDYNYQSVISPWMEYGVTWNNAPVISGSPITTLGAIAPNAWAEYDVTSAITGNGVYSFALTTNSNDSLTFNTKEAASNQPELVIEIAGDAPPPLPVPVLVSPLDTVTVRAPEFSWEPVTGATHYDFFLERADGSEVYSYGFDSTACDSTVCTASPWVFLLRGDYRWRMRAATSPDNQSQWSVEEDFFADVIPNPNTPTPLSPVNVAITSRSWQRVPRFTWSVVPGASEYRFRLDNLTAEQRIADQSFSSSYCNAQTCSVTLTGVNIPIALYKWSVQAVLPDGAESAWSDAAGFIYIGQMQP